MELLGYFFLAIVAICYLVAMIIGMIGILPYGLIGFIALTGFGLLLIKVVKERLTSEEDDHYSRTVDK